MSREILLLVDALAHEKNVAREVIFTAVELALASATKKNLVLIEFNNVLVEISLDNIEKARLDPEF